MELTHDVVFEKHRGLVFSIAYDMTGSVSEAEDVAQETYVRWRSATTEIADPRAYLARTAANQARNALRTSARRREDYLGPWLPEPLVTGAGGAQQQRDDPEQSALRADAVSTALLIVLQSLSDDERAAFILREVFEFDYADVAEALGKSEAAARQVVHRARVRVRDRHRRNAVRGVEHRQVVQQFAQATATGDVEALLHLLAPEVTLTADGGGKSTAALRPVVGADKTLRFMLGLAEKYGASGVTEPVELNGAPGMLFREGDRVTTTFQLDVTDGLIRHIYIVRNPDKLQHLQ